MEKIELMIPFENIENILGTVTSPSIVLSELIKNSVDSNASNIRIDINTQPKNLIIVTDDGDGLSFDDIKNLGCIGESTKKRNSYLYRKDGAYLSGSKGLGILSLFSIANSFTLETEKCRTRYRITWKKGQSSFLYEQITPKGSSGTEIKITNIDDDCIPILTDENELNKLKHISIKNYTKSNLSSKNITFFINGEKCTYLDISNINDLKDNFISILKFQFNSITNKLDFQYLSENEIINKNSISINLSNDIDIHNILFSNYNLSEVTYKGEPCRYLGINLESFSGEFFVAQKKKDIELHKFGPGVRVFINQFAMYGYLDRENDWLNFSVYSLLRKNTRYKPHNVFGYVHFDNFNENKSNLKISNERAYFIENGAYKKFQEIMKNIVTVLAFNIDVADKNNWINPTSTENNSHKTYTKNIQKNADLKKNNMQFNNLDEHSQNENSLDKSTASTVDMANNPNNRNEHLKSPKPANMQSSSEENNYSISFDKKPKFNFFKSSRVLKYPDKIQIGYDDLIGQLSKLSYKDYYLLYVIAFRAILEDISKKYLNIRRINLYSDFGQNIKAMIDDILQVIKDKEIIRHEDKVFIENRLGGYHAFKNYFESISTEFYCNGKQGNKAIKLNSFTHSPRWMEIEEAEDIANNIILPLLVISSDIIERMKK